MRIKAPGTTEGNRLDDILLKNISFGGNIAMGLADLNVFFKEITERCVMKKHIKACFLIILLFAVLFPPIFYE